MDEQQQTIPPPQYPDGSRVLCADGQTLGEVVATYRDHLIVERGYFFPTNFYVPYAAIAEAAGGDIVLSLNAREALAQGWHTPPADPVVPEAPAAPPVVAAPPVAATPTTREPVAPAPTLTPAPEPAYEDAVTTTEAPVGAPEIEHDNAPVEQQVNAPDEPPVPEQVSLAEAPPEEHRSTTAPPAVPPAETVALEEAMEVQSYQPDASVPPPAEPEEAGTVSLTPSFVGIPGRRLTDAELWSLLEPKDDPAEPEGPTAQPGDAADETATPDKPGEG